MKFRFLTVFSLILILALMFTSCDIIEEPFDRAEDMIDDRLDAIEDSVENRLDGSKNPAGNSKLSQADAKDIALNHAGFTAEEVNGLRTEYDFDDGISKYEVHFRQGRLEYEYSIHADTGAILSVDIDD